MENLQERIIVVDVDGEVEEGRDGWPARIVQPSDAGNPDRDLRIYGENKGRNNVHETEAKRENGKNLHQGDEGGNNVVVLAVIIGLRFQLQQNVVAVRGRGFCDGRHERPRTNQRRSSNLLALGMHATIATHTYIHTYIDLFSPDGML